MVLSCIPGVSQAPIEIVLKVKQNLAPFQNRDSIGNPVLQVSQVPPKASLCYGAGRGAHPRILPCLPVPQAVLPGCPNCSFLPPWCLPGCPIDLFLPPWCLVSWPMNPFLPPWCLSGAFETVQLIGGKPCVPGASQAFQLILSCLSVSPRLSNWLFPASLVPLWCL